MKYRKKPVVIDAWHIETQQDARRVEGICTGGADCKGHGPEDSWPHVHTLEGDHTWSEGDWLIRGVKGEFYFCKPDIFAATYEPASSPSPDRIPQMTNQILQEVADERVAQDAQWGGAEHDDQHLASEWSGFREKFERRDGKPRRENLIKIAALAVAEIESIDRAAR